MDILESIKCDIADPTFLLFNDIPSLVYVSHIPIFVVAFLLGFFVFWSNRQQIENRIFFAAMIFFGSWVFLDQMFWAANRADTIMFVWTTIVLIEPMVHICMLYLAHILLTGRDMPFKKKLIALLIFLPQIFLVPTTLTLSSFDIADCLPNESTFAYYSYTIETIFILWITLFAISSLRNVHAERSRRERLAIMTGIIAFLVSFTGGNLYGSITDDWTIGAIGLFGMTLLSGFFAYSIVKYQTFNMKLISTQALVMALVFTSGAQVFLAKTFPNRVLTSVTFVLMLTLGTLLIREVKKEVRRKEELEVLSKELSVANTELKRLDASKSEFISIASHQLRTPLTAIRGFLDLLMEGAYGKLEPKIQETISKITIANNRLMSLVENLLNISRIEAGRIQYQFTPTHIEDIVSELEDMFKLSAKEKQLAFKVVQTEKPLPLLSLDLAKIREVISNIIDNAMKYTPSGGSVTVSFERHPECVAVIVADTGMGIDPNDLPHLFKKFERGSQAARVNVSSTGLGLYVGRKFAEAHGGTITAESKGKGKGAQFILELPIHVIEKAKELS